MSGAWPERGWRLRRAKSATSHHRLQRRRQDTEIQVLGQKASLETVWPERPRRVATFSSPRWTAAMLSAGGTWIGVSSN
eukprot:g16566.t1